MTTEPKHPRCPVCGGKSKPTSGGLFQCTKCRGFHDGVPEEGGDFSDHNPGVRLEREERQQNKRKNFGERR